MDFLMSTPSSLSESTSSSSTSADFCVVCGDKAIGKHYGAVACNGCKGFFRRSVWQNLQYVCRFTKQCNVDKDHRNACRFCRFQKCLADGMKPEAIQNERDRIGSTKRRKRSGPSSEHNSDSEGTPSPKMEVVMGNTMSRKLIEMLLDIENRLASNQSMNALFRDESEQKNSRQRAVNYLIGWTNMLHPLPEVPLADKVLLLKKFSSAFTLLGTMQRSMALPHFVLPNDQVLSMSHTPPELFQALNRIVDELLTPLRRLRTDHAEFSCLKALLLLNPDVVGLSNPTRERIRESRDALLKALFAYMSNTQNSIDASLRVSSLLMIIPSLISGSTMLMEFPTLADLFGLGDVIKRETSSPKIESPPLDLKSMVQNIQPQPAASVPTAVPVAPTNIVMSKDLLAQIMSNPQLFPLLPMSAPTTSSPPMPFVGGSEFGNHFQQMPVKVILS